MIDLDELKEKEALKFKRNGFDDLNVDYLYEKDGCHYIAIAHNFVQNGDVMCDPDMEVKIVPNMKMAEALSFQRSAPLMYQEVYAKDENGDVLVNTKIKKELNSFLNMWLDQIKFHYF